MMDVVLFAFNFELVECCCFVCLFVVVVFALLVNSEKHSEILVINLDRDCSVSQVLIPHREFPDTDIECHHSVFHPWNKHLS